MRAEIIQSTIKDLNNDIQYERISYKKIKDIQKLSKNPEVYEETLSLIEESAKILNQQLRGVLNGKLPY